MTAALDRDDLLNLLIRRQLGDDRPDGIAALTGSDPQAAPLAELLAQRQRDLQARLDQAEEEQQRQEQELALEEERQRRRAERRERGEVLRAHLEELGRALATAQALVDEAAAALGACAVCFGTDPGCRWCRGRGRPGFMPPDPAAFHDLVVPAVQTYVRLRGRVTTEPTTTREGRDT